MLRCCSVYLSVCCVTDLCKNYTIQNPQWNILLKNEYKLNKRKSLAVFSFNLYDLSLSVDINVEKDTVPTKRCKATSFYEMGSNFESSATYKSFNHSTPAMCYTECINDDHCWGYAFNNQTALCDLSINMFPQYTDCDHCSFVAKACSSEYIFSSVYNVM